MSIQRVLFEHRNEYGTHGPLPTLGSSSDRDTNKQAFTIPPNTAHLLRQMPLKQHGEILTVFSESRKLSKLTSDAAKTQKLPGARENSTRAHGSNYKGEEMQHI